MKIIHVVGARPNFMKIAPIVAEMDRYPNYYGERDNFVATITFDDGTVATLTYTALGSTDYPKERT